MTDNATVSAQQAADLLGYSQNHIYRLLRSGELRGRLVGRVWFITREAVQEVKNRQVEGRLPRSGG